MSFRYLIECHWLKQWKKFVGFDSWDVYGVGDQVNNPGPLDNSNLFKGTVCTLHGLYTVLNSSSHFPVSSNEYAFALKLAFVHLSPPLPPTGKNFLPEFSW